ncbi:paraquat-inducible membrane protein A [Phragmitibacter flavus]|uniref:Paraquat-inducible membrane protein A n=1 Tax=Phragmitibacter flavus TaxID=2576071 RepID=A0A5R8KJG2_9BACT|nr:paraquat-inducible protein A [Phragmitibacter flavus]TLD72397.1 paraquat-inducible membrane protein A [Phragmitibacter flavus]
MTPEPNPSPSPISAASQGLASCHVCGKVSPVTVGHCPRCDTPLHLRKPQSLERTWAFLIAAVILYIPANTMPIMTVQGIGGAEKNTILSGVVRFWEMKSYPVAIVIFTASVLIPLLKVIALVWLCLAARGRSQTAPRSLSRLYHITELLGRWSMVDVFVVAILVCLVQLGAIMTITPGPAALCFSAVVILTMFSAMSFDPRLIWDRHHEKPNPSSSLPSLPTNE